MLEHTQVVKELAMLERKAFYSPHEVAEIGGLSTSTILNYIRSGKLYAVKLSERTYRIPLGAVIATFYPEQKSSPTVVRGKGGREMLDRWLRQLRKEHEPQRRKQAKITSPKRGRQRERRLRSAVRT